MAASGAVVLHASTWGKFMSHELPTAEVERHVIAGTAVPVHEFESLPLPATASEVAMFVAMRAAACVGADYSNMASLDVAGRCLRPFHDTFLAPEIAERYSDIPLDAPFPIAAAARSGTAVLLTDLDAYREQFPAVLTDTIAARIQASASLPLYRDDGTLVGVIGFAWTAPTVFDAKLRSALQAVADLCAATIERAERYDADHQFIVELSGNLLGALPVMAALDMSARYLPASNTASVGGDWYEGLLLDDQRLALVVGDVTGHGLAAAADMALLRGMITALLHSGVAVADVFSEMSGVLLQRSGLLLATAALVVVDVADETITYATAGHPPPFMQPPTDELRRLDAANAPMIGLPSTLGIAATVPFPVGSRLVMFTDGLVERRDRPFEVGIEQLATSLTALTNELISSDVADALLEALLDSGPAGDDIAILVIRHVAA
jgi:serine phosphatase RsbU (regulator of sigma subunit)